MLCREEAMLPTFPEPKQYDHEVDYFRARQLTVHSDDVSLAAKLSDPLAKCAIVTARKVRLEACHHERSAP